MRFGVLGAVEARCATGEPIALGGPRSRSLLAMMLLDAGRTVGARRLIEGLYGERAPADAAHALQSQVSRLRRALKAGGLAGDLVLLEPGGYRLAIDPEDVDVHRFERLAGEGRRALTAGDHATADRLLREALALWRGRPLADVADASFAEAQTARLEELRLAATEDHVEARLARGEHRALAEELPGTVAAHPLRERLHGQLMRALAGGGRRAEALAAFEDARRVLTEELGVDPSPGLRRVHLAVLRAEDPPRAAVPAQLTSFVGREDDLARVGELLREQRLVTLTGPGGVGKTRLAIEAGWGQDACFVELSPVGDGTAVPQALINALGLRDAALLPALSGPSEPADRLVAGLAGRAVLLVLDGCEHVVDEVARLVHRLLAACPDLRILATSRERLDIAGETLHPVRPLAAEAAVRLFTDRAVAVQPSFTADDAALGSAARICRALDGLPLAIELAAARLRALTVEEVAARLDDRFRLLSRGGRSATPRHRTLRSAMAWSWDLLTPPERALAAGLTIFRGGATLDAVARVCGPSEDEVIDLLAALVDKSLVEAGDGRYRMLETVRAYCAERPAESGERERLRRAYAAYFLDLARTAEPRLRGSGQVEWLARLDAERGNLQAVLHWSVGADPVLGLRLIAALSWHGQLRGLSGERAPVATELLRAIGPEPPAGLAEEYLLCVANAAAGDNAHDEELRVRLELLERSRAVLRHPFVSALRLMVIGPGEIGGADAWSRAFARLDEGVELLIKEDPAAARAFGAALGGFRAVGDRWGVATALDQLAGLAEPVAAVQMMDEAIELAGLLGMAEDLVRFLVRKADALAAAGDLDAAHAECARAAELASRAGIPEARANARRGLADVARLRGDLATARGLYELALRGCERSSMSSAWTRSRILAGLGRIAEAESGGERALSGR